MALTNYGIQVPISCVSYLGRVVRECWDLLASLSNKNVYFRFVKRSDKVAHFLARNHCSGADLVWRVGDVHSEFIHVMLDDLRFNKIVSFSSKKKSAIKILSINLLTKTQKFKLKHVEKIQIPKINKFKDSQLDIQKN